MTAIQNRYSDQEREHMEHFKLNILPSVKTQLELIKIHTTVYLHTTAQNKQQNCNWIHRKVVSID